MDQKNKNLYDFDTIEKQLKSLPEKELPAEFHSNMMAKIYNLEEGDLTINWTDKLFKLLRSKTFGIAVAGLLLVIVVISFMMPQYSYKTNLGSAPQSMDMMSNNSVSRDVRSKGSGTNETAEVAYEGSIASTQQTANKTTSAAAPNDFNNEVLGLENMKEGRLFNTPAAENLKIIKTANMALEVVDFDGVVNTISNMAVANGGYVQNTSSYIYDSNPDKKEYLKAGSITIRIPKEKYDAVKIQVGSIGKITSTNESTDNVTEKYLETESRIKMLEVEQESLLNIMKKATKVEDLIQLESRLGEVRTELETYKSQLQNWDKLVSLSTINIELTQVRSEDVIAPVDKNLSQRISESFINSINNIKTSTEDFAVWFVGHILELIFWLVILIVGILIGRKVIRKIRK